MRDEPAKPDRRASSMLRAMLIACAVLAVATIVGPIVRPQFLSARRIVHQPVCAMGLDQLESAKALLALEQKLAPGTVIQESALTVYLKDNRLPKCPQGGKYTINPIGVPVSCSIHGAPEGESSVWSHTNLIPPALLAPGSTNRSRNLSSKPVNTIHQP